MCLLACSPFVALESTGLKDEQLYGRFHLLRAELVALTTLPLSLLNNVGKTLCSDCTKLSSVTVRLKREAVDATGAHALAE